MRQWIRSLTVEILKKISQVFAALCRASASQPGQCFIPFAV